MAVSLSPNRPRNVDWRRAAALLYGDWGTSKAFVKGCTQMVFAGFIIGMARAISVVMSDGRIIDTVVYYMSLPIAATGPVVGANLM